MPKISARTVQAVGIFVLVSLVASSIVIAISYFVSNRGEQVRIEEAREIAQTEEINTEPDEKPAAEEEKTSSDAEEEKVSPDDEDSDVIVEDPEQLPDTGPADQLFNIVVVGAIAFAVSSYIRSRSIVSKL